LSEQIPPPSRLRKGFLVVGIVLLILGFFFFYLASSVGYDYVTTYNNEINLAYPSSQYPQSGAYEYYVRNVIMQPNDALTVSYPVFNGTLQIVLVEQVSDINNTVLAVSGYPSSERFVYYKNEPQFNGIVVNVYLVAQNIQNVTLSTTMTLNHYETPQWIYFGAGVVLSSLAVIPIFKSKK
jgi:hypothetical protein